MISITANADNLNFRSGVGTNHAIKSSIHSINFETEIGKTFHYRFDIGFWSGTRDIRKGSWFTSFLLGAQVGEKRSIHGIIDLGIVAISNPDSLLSSAFQFTEEASIGYDKFSIGFKHFSNVGITKPNIGRNYLFFNYKMPW